MVVRRGKRKVQPPEPARPSITIDLSYAAPGRTHQERPTFTDIDAAIAYLQSQKTTVAKALKSASQKP